MSAMSNAVATAENEVTAEDTRPSRTSRNDRRTNESRATKKVKVTISLTESQYEDLVQLADEHEISLSALVTRGIALQKFLLEHKDAEILLKQGDQLRQIFLVG
jgi:hypothetical protein